MEVQFKEPKIIKSMYAGSGSPGYYATSDIPFRFESCREKFLTKITNRTKGFYFRHKKNGGANVAAFILKTEEILKLKERSEFALTNEDCVLWIEPCKFWNNCKMKRALLTILLRAGIRYDRNIDNYEQAAFKENYLKITQKAFKRFLFGYTKYIGEEPHGSSALETYGWVYFFKQKSNKDIKQVWVLPRKKKSLASSVVEDELWS